MKKERKDFFKITFEDMQLAKDFFEKEKHYIEWFYAVSEYYQGNLIQIKNKIVQKYFNNYKKTMDFIIKSKHIGEKGGLQKAMNQEVKSQTLEGVVEQPLYHPPYLISNNKIENINNKIESINNKTLIKQEELINKLEKLISEENFDRQLTYDYMNDYIQFAEYYYSDEERKKISDDLLQFKIIKDE
jgi:hypothetical protein